MSPNALRIFHHDLWSGINSKERRQHFLSPHLLIPMSMPTELEELSEIVQLSTGLNYSYVFCLTFLVYDTGEYLLKLGQRLRLLNTNYKYFVSLTRSVNIARHNNYRNSQVDCEVQLVLCILGAICLGKRSEFVGP